MSPILSSRAIKQQFDSIPGSESSAARSRIGIHCIAEGTEVFRNFPGANLCQRRSDAVAERQSVSIHDVVDLFENSMHFAEELLRRPELIVEIAHARSGVPSHYQDLLSQIHDPSELRKFFRREMLRIQVESVCMRAPIFNTLGRTSDLADCGDLRRLCAVT